MKNNIRTLILALIITVFSSGHIVAQGMPVYDNTNFVSLVKQLIESGKQTAEMIKSVKFLKDAKDAIVKVSGAVQQLKAIEEIVENNQLLIQVAQNDLQDILNSPHIKPEEIERVSKSFSKVIENSLDTMDFIDEILSSDFLKMSDAERTEILKKKELESKEMVSSITTKTKRYRDIISFRKMQDRVNNRETNY